MGMYDIINDEQMKIFHIPIINIPNSLEGIVSYSGGSLNTYNIGDEVPYKTDWYNYTKNFNILDIFPDVKSEMVIHLIRNGKNTGSVPVRIANPNIFEYDTYDTRGQKMCIKSKEDVQNYLQAIDELNNAMKEKKKEAEKKFTNYIINNKDDKDYHEQYKKLYLEYEKERISNEKILKVYHENIDKYFLPPNINKDFQEFGALVDGLSSGIFRSALRPNATFLVNDDRLTFIVGYNEMIKYIKNDKDFLQKYFNAFSLNDNDKDFFLDTLSDLEELYEKLNKVVLKEEQFFKKNSLSDILDGKYKKYYLEYNVLPYENFDYSVWDVCVYEEREKSYNSFKKELDNYVKENINIDER